MRRIRVMEHVSLDGMIRPGDPHENSAYADGEWTAPYRTPEGAAAFVAAQGTDFDLLLGRRTYDLWAAYWPKMTGGPFAAALNAATKFVATHRADGLDWGPVEALGVGAGSDSDADSDALAGVRRLRGGSGPDLIVWGSASLVARLLAEGLVDEIVLAVYPVLLGRGTRCFPDDAGPRGFALAGSVKTPSGVLVNTYRPVDPSG